MIRLDDLEAVFGIITNHLRRQGIEAVEIEEEYYWEVDKESRHDMACDRVGTTIGQLSEDLERLFAIENQRDEPVGYALVWLASVLRYVGEKHIA